MPVLTKKQRSALVNHVNSLIAENKVSLSAFKESCLEIDRMYYSLNETYLKDVAACKSSGKTPPDHITVPLVLSNTEAAVGYLAEVFFARNNLFTTAGRPKDSGWLVKVERLIAQYYRNYDWKAELLVLIRSTIKHNFALLDVPWVTSGSPNSLGGTSLPASHREGIALKAVSVYTADWDMTVTPRNLASEGSFVAYSEYLTLNNFRRKFKDVEGQYAVGVTKNKNHAVPIWEYLQHTAPTENWAQHFGLEDKDTVATTKLNGVKVTYASVWLDGNILNSTKSSVADWRIWRVIIVNDSQVLSAVQTDEIFNTHTILSSYASADEHGYTTQSIGERASSSQDTASKLMTARLESLRRAIGDRALYNPAYIAAQHISGKSASSKIPIRPEMQRDPDALSKAYRRVDFSDNTSNAILSDVGLISNDLVELATGVSRFKQGAQKGNRSAAEFNYLSSAQDARLNLVALAFDGGVLAKIKHLIKAYLYTKQPEVNILDPATGQMEKFDFTEQQGDFFDFRIIDGLQSAGLLDDTEFLISVIQSASSMPQLQPLAVGMLSYVLELRTDFSITDFLETNNDNTDPATDGRGATRAIDSPTPTSPSEISGDTVPTGGADVPTEPIS